jgi:hypothetical protein
VIAGGAQLYSAATGNYGTPAQVAQVGNIMGGPVTGFGTLMAGGSMASAERNAGYESLWTAGTGAVQAMGEIADQAVAKGLILNTSGGSFTYLGMQPGASGGCGGKH